MFDTFGVYAGAAAPGVDVTPSGVVTFRADRVNTLEVSGRASAGTGKLYILRKITYRVGGVDHFQYRPWTEDRPADSMDFVDGYFSIRIRVRQDDPVESFILWNPNGALTIDPTKPLLATMSLY